MVVTMIDLERLTLPKDDRWMEVMPRLRLMVEVYHMDIFNLSERSGIKVTALALIYNGHVAPTTGQWVKIRTVLPNLPEDWKNG